MENEIEQQVEKIVEVLSELNEQDHIKIIENEKRIVKFIKEQL